MSQQNHEKSLSNRDNTISQISRVRRGANQVLLDQLNELGLTDFVPSHGEILMQLLTYEELTMSEIAMRINKDRSTVTALISKLKKNGYVDTRKAPYCGRTTIVRITEKGRTLEGPFLAISDKLDKVYRHNIDEQDLVIFRKVLTQIQNNFDQENRLNHE